MDQSASGISMGKAPKNRTAQRNHQWHVVGTEDALLNYSGTPPDVVKYRASIRRITDCETEIGCSSWTGINWIGTEKLELRSHCYGAPDIPRESSTKRLYSA